MRAADRKEISATRYDASPEAIAYDCINSGKYAWTINKGRPVCAVGAFEVWPGVWRVWMYATEDFNQVAIFTTRFVKKLMIPTLGKHAHRAECQSMKGHREAHRWLEAIGGKRESTLKNYGKNGEDFYQYSHIWRK